MEEEAGLHRAYESRDHVAAFRLEHTDALIDLAECILGKSSENANTDLHGVAAQGSKQFAVHEGAVRAT